MAQIQLAFREYGRDENSLLVLHGLLGSSQNWQRAAKGLSEKFHVWVVDQRNHGDSPHTDEHSLAALREDVKAFLEQHHLDRVYLLGHSMGGMAAMEFAFHYPERLHALLVEDVAPRAYHSSSTRILEILSALPLQGFATRNEVEMELAKSIDSAMTRQFLLTNLTRNEDRSFAWRVNLPALQEFQREMSVYTPSAHARYEGETLFLGGAHSEYHLDRDREVMLAHFPHSRLVMIPNAGHWLHFEAVEAFNRIAINFMEKGLAGL